MNRIDGLAGLEAMVGKEIGVSEWMTVTQERINQFAEATGDHQWIHLDVERCKAESEFGTTIAHGFLTLSLVPHLKEETFAIDNITTFVNYGLGKVRFPAPVPSGARVRGHFTMKSLEHRGEGRALGITEVTVEVEGSERPACIAETMTFYIV